MMRKIFPLLVVLVVSSLVLMAKTVLAQFPSLGGVAVNVEIADNEATVGDIVSVSGQGLKRASNAYDSQMYGVIVAAPVLSVEPKTDKAHAVLSEGEAQVRVTVQVDPINVGDFVTSSDIAGVGQKATKTGYVLGKALAGYSDKSKVGVIPVTVAIGFHQVGLDIKSVSGIVGLLKETLSDPVKFQRIARYLLAAIVAILTIILSSVSFIKFMATGIEAIGRNPMARRTIIASMVMSGTVVALLTIAGLGVAAAIIFLGKR